jgi:glutathione S-transferase
MMTAKACGVKIEEIVYDSAQHSLKIEAGSTFPILDTEEGFLLSQTTAILEYIAHGHAMLGKTPFEQAQVSQWLNFVR